MKALVADSVERKDFEWAVQGVGEVESYEERVVDKRNNSPLNLECVSRAELMRRNAGRDL